MSLDSLLKLCLLLECLLLLLLLLLLLTITLKICNKSKNNRLEPNWNHFQCTTTQQQQNTKKTCLHVLPILFGGGEQQKKTKKEDLETDWREETIVWNFYYMPPRGCCRTITQPLLLMMIACRNVKLVLVVVLQKIWNSSSVMQLP